jgi:hypothetical protein
MDLGVAPNMDKLLISFYKEMNKSENGAWRGFLWLGFRGWLPEQPK